MKFNYNLTKQSLPNFKTLKKTSTNAEQTNSKDNLNGGIRKSPAKTSGVDNSEQNSLTFDDIKNELIIGNYTHINELEKLGYKYVIACVEGNYKIRITKEGEKAISILLRDYFDEDINTNSSSSVSTNTLSETDKTTKSEETLQPEKTQVEEEVQEEVQSEEVTEEQTQSSPVRKAPAKVEAETTAESETQTETAAEEEASLLDNYDYADQSTKAIYPDNPNGATTLEEILKKYKDRLNKVNVLNSLHETSGTYADLPQNLLIDLANMQSSDACKTPEALDLAVHAKVLQYELMAANKGMIKIEDYDKFMEELNDVMSKIEALQGAPVMDINSSGFVQYHIFGYKSQRGGLDFEIAKRVLEQDNVKLISFIANYLAAIHPALQFTEQDYQTIADSIPSVSSCDTAYDLCKQIRTITEEKILPTKKTELPTTQDELTARENIKKLFSKCAAFEYMTEAEFDSAITAYCKDEENPYQRFWEIVQKFEDRLEALYKNNTVKDVYYIPVMTEIGGLMWKMMNDCKKDHIKNADEFELWMEGYILGSEWERSQLMGQTELTDENIKEFLNQVLDWQKRCDDIGYKINWPENTSGLQDFTYQSKDQISAYIYTTLWSGCEGFIPKYDFDTFSSPEIQELLIDIMRNNNNHSFILRYNSGIGNGAYSFHSTSELEHFVGTYIEKTYPDMPSRGAEHVCKIIKDELENVKTFQEIYDLADTQCKKYMDFQKGLESTYDYKLVYEEKNWGAANYGVKDHIAEIWEKLYDNFEDDPDAFSQLEEVLGSYYPRILKLYEANEYNMDTINRAFFNTLNSMDKDGEKYSVEDIENLLHGIIMAHELQTIGSGYAKIEDITQDPDKYWDELYEVMDKISQKQGYDAFNLEFSELHNNYKFVFKFYFNEENYNNVLNIDTTKGNIDKDSLYYGYYNDANIRDLKRGNPLFLSLLRKDENLLFDFIKRTFANMKPDDTYHYDYDYSILNDQEIKQVIKNVLSSYDMNSLVNDNALFELKAQMINEAKKILKNK